MRSRFHRIFLTLLLVSGILVFPIFTFAQSSQDITLQIPFSTGHNQIFDNLPSCNGTDCNTIFTYVTKLYIWGLRATAILSVLVFVWAGFLWMTAGGEQKNIKKAKDLVSSNLIGVGLLLGSYLLLYTINPLLVAPNAQPINPLDPIELKLEKITPSDIPSPIDSSSGGGGPVGRNGVPYRKQLTGRGCALTTAAMLIAYYVGGDKPEINQTLIQQWNGGSETAYWGSILNGANHQYNQHLQMEWISKSQAINLMKQGKPIILHGSGPIWRKGNSGGTHFVVITGYNASTGTFGVNDPGWGKTSATLAEIQDASSEDFGYIHP